MTDNFLFLNRQEMFSLSPEQTAKCNAQGAEKKSTSMPYICQESGGTRIFQEATQ